LRQKKEKTAPEPTDFQGFWKTARPEPNGPSARDDGDATAGTGRRKSATAKKRGKQSVLWSAHAIGITPGQGFLPPPCTGGKSRFSLCEAGARYRLGAFFLPPPLPLFARRLTA